MKSKLSVFFLLLLMAGYSGAQVKVNIDSVFNRAIDLSRAKSYAASIAEATKAANLDPTRGDIPVFIANVYSWENKNDSALVYIRKAQQLNYHQPDFYEAWTNILLRSGKYNELLASCNEAEKNHYSAEDILKKRVYAYSGLKEYGQAVDLLEAPASKRYLSLEPFNGLYSDMLMKRNKSSISAFYSFDAFNKIYTPQQLASLGYSFSPFENTSFGLRANYANRFGLNDVQLEGDMYHTFASKNYLYLNYGFGFAGSLFPRHRIGVEDYMPLKNSMEASLGLRFINYDLPNNILIATGHLEKYFGKSWVSLRPYYVYSLTKNIQSASLIANYRLFGSTPFDYWGIELGYGNSPDDTYSISQQGGFNQLTAYHLKLEKNIMISRTSDFHIGLGYSREEFPNFGFLNKYTIELGYKIRFK